MPDLVSDDERLKRIQALTQIQMPNQPQAQSVPTAPNVPSTPQAMPPPLRPIGGTPQASPQKPPPMAGSSEDYGNQIQAIKDKQNNPWGSPGNHDTVLGKVGHTLSAIGQGVGAAINPSIVAGIPGTQLNMQGKENALENKQAGAKKLEDTEAATKANESVAQENADSEKTLRGAQAGALEPTDYTLPDGSTISVQKKDVANLEKAIQGNKTKEDTTADTNQTKKDVGAAANTSHEVVGAAHDATAQADTDKQIASRKAIADLHEAQSNFRAKLSDATKGGGTEGNLTAANKGRSEFASTVTAQIPGLVEEVKALNDKIGPGAGRWNDFWVNKGGLNDPAFAGLDQDLKLFASAVAVTHFGARGGGAKFIEAMEKNFSQAQSPEDLVARIKSADKWLEGYAHMHGANNPTQGGTNNDPLGIRQ